MRKIAVFFFSVILALTFLSACAAGLKNYEKVSLGMSRDEVKNIVGSPSRVFEGESTGETGLINKTGKYEIWFYRGSVLIFSEDKLVNKSRKGKP